MSLRFMASLTSQTHLQTSPSLEILDKLLSLKNLSLTLPLHLRLIEPAEYGHAQIKMEM
jgi:hypothetical protein